MASYQDSLESTAASSNSFDFSCFDNRYNIEFRPPPNVIPSEGDPFYSANWEETPPHNGSLYSTPLKWESPEPAFEYQLPQNLSMVNSLTAVQQEELRNIAMPRNTQYNSHRSPHSTESCKSYSISSPDTNDPNRKRKSLASVEDDEDEDLNPLLKKTAHNMIEKRYRTNLNDKIAALRDSVPSLRIMSKSARGEDTLDDREDLQGLTPAHKLNKATVLSKATEYIYHLEKRNKRLQQENSDHRARLAAFETLFRTGSMDFNQAQTINNQFQFSSDYSTPDTPPATSQQIIIQSSDDIRGLRCPNNQPVYQQVPQEIIAHREQQQLRPDGWNSNSYMGKLMVGTMAGLMIMEGLSEAEQNPESSMGRGLFALPTSLLRFLKLSLNSMNFNLFSCHISANEILWYSKFFVILSSFLYMFLPGSSSCYRPRSNRGKIQSTSLAAAPSLASPIQVRRQAWLTAIQTVWIPRHNFFMEAAALYLKIAKLSTRNVFGLQAYTYLTGITEQQEAARIKAWSIALDAQLVGGDIEVNKSRLTLTLLASETLPDTPARLMLKALHIRVLLWELGNSGFHGYCLCRKFAAKLARWKWRNAMLLHQLNIHQEDEHDILPEYLVKILQQSCDDVLNDSIIQRAYNMAWNFPTTNNACEETDCMDTVVDDFAIRSPLDAVAAWFSSLVLQRALSKSLEIHDDDSLRQKLVIEDIELAIKTAPTGSNSHIQALVARSFLIKEKRGASIAEALQVLGPLNKHIIHRTPPNLIDTNTSIPNLPEIRLTIRCAMAIAHIERCPASCYPKKAEHIIRTILPRKLTLFGFTALFKLMEQINGHSQLAINCVHSLEKLAGGLRIWVGGKDGERSGLSLEVKKKKVEYCLAITKRIVGMQDAGYASMSEAEDLSPCSCTSL